MTTDGGLDRWHVDGPIVWHSETAGLDYWHVDGIWSDLQDAGGEPEAKYYGQKGIAIGICEGVGAGVG